MLVLVVGQLPLLKQIKSGKTNNGVFGISQKVGTSAKG